MMAPEVYQEARAGAPMHVQIWRTGSPDATRAGRIDGRVVRIFRDHDRQLRWGQRIAFHVPVIDRASRDAPTAGGTIYLDGDHLVRTRWFEAFLASWDGVIHLVHSQICPIRHPTRRPVCGADAKGFLCEGNLGPP
ncbi:MAG: hypothetical protein ACREL5_12920 [Gemmatimonadales bacterium]